MAVSSPQKRSLANTVVSARPCRRHGDYRGGTIDMAVAWRLLRLCQENVFLADTAVSSPRWLQLGYD